ncbi:MAG: hypothetical protein WAP30_02460 [Acetomicrobium sp.]
MDTRPSLIGLPDMAFLPSSEALNIEVKKKLDLDFVINSRTD